MMILKPKLLTNARRLHNLRQADLAKMVGVSQQSISKIERGLTGCDARTADKICKALDLDIDEMFGDPNRKRVRRPKAAA